MKIDDAIELLKQKKSIYGDSVNIRIVDNAIEFYFENDNGCVIYTVEKISKDL